MNIEEIYSESGMKHKNEEKTNHNAINHYMDDEYLFVCISDGKNGSIASKITVKAAINYCKSNLDEFFNSKESFLDCKRDVIWKIREEYDNICKKKIIDFSSLLCTLILFGYRRRDHRYFIIHIGDGAIFESDCGNEESKFEYLSAPHRKANIFQTYCVNDSDVFENIRYQFGEKRNKRILMCTEGFYETLGNINDSLKNNIKMHFDDCTYFEFVIN